VKNPLKSKVFRILRKAEAELQLADSNEAGGSSRGLFSPGILNEQKFKHKFNLIGKLTKQLIINNISIFIKKFRPKRE
jgi:hypothetical protein